MTSPVTRRSVLIGSVVSVAGGLAGFVTARNSDAAKAAPPGTRANGYGSTTGYSTPTGDAAAAGVLLIAESKVPQGNGVILTAKKVVVTKDTSGTIHAFSAVCTHQGCPVSSVSDGLITCPCHGSQFDADTGAVVTGPATAPLAAVPTTIKDGNVYAPSDG
jgi:Rieske Fe-S protein